MAIYEIKMKMRADNESPPPSASAPGNSTLDAPGRMTMWRIEQLPPRERNLVHRIVEAVYNDYRARVREAESQTNEASSGEVARHPETRDVPVVAATTQTTPRARAIRKRR